MKVFVDMDNVLVDFQSAIPTVTADELEKTRDAAGDVHYDDVPGIFSRMAPVDGAIEAMHQLKDAGFDLYILSTAPWGNPSAWSDKLDWVRKHLDDIFHKRIILTHEKGLLAADKEAYMIDDRPNHGVKDGFGDRWLQLETEDLSGGRIERSKHIFRNWSEIVDYLKKIQSLG